MRAIVLERFGGLDTLVYKEIPDPEPKAGYVVIEIKAFISGTDSVRSNYYRSMEPALTSGSQDTRPTFSILLA